jgi:hypothetical protein
MSIRSEFDHAPGASLDYGFDYATANWLNSNETIVSSVWTVTGSDVVLSSTQIASGVTSVFATGGTAGNIYTLTNTITTDSTPARTDSRIIVLSCKAY